MRSEVKRRSAKGACSAGGGLEDWKFPGARKLQPARLSRCLVCLRSSSRFASGLAGAAVGEQSVQGQWVRDKWNGGRGGRSVGVWGADFGRKA